jgi:signal transduction histidine kinase
MEGSGSIATKVYQADGYVNIDVSDTGKGIPASKFKTVFQPGYTTKKRGWGLGLSLAKRIIEDYHSGRIFVKKSSVNGGTTFSIQLPK